MSSKLGGMYDHMRRDSLFDFFFQIAKFRIIDLYFQFILDLSLALKTNYMCCIFTIRKYHATLFL